MTKVITAFALATAAAFALAIPAQAVEGRMGQTTACSKTNTSKCKTGAVRDTNLGQQVRLPGGTWVDCNGDCNNRLRQKTVDFWYEQKLNN
jgi:hypothetical protein